MASNKKKSSSNRTTAAPTAPVVHDKNKAHAIETCNMRQFLKEHPLLAALLPQDGVLFECNGEAPAPCKDYGQLQITPDKVIMRWWKITIRNIEGAMYPGEIKNSYEDFYYDESAQREIWRIFGQATVNYCLNLVRGKYDWLTLLPVNAQVRILSFVTLDDIPQIALVSKALRSLCRNNDLWQIFYAKHYGWHSLQNRDLIHLAERRGWRHVFFTNRLKLQMQLRREAQRDRHHPEDPSDVIKARARRSELQPSPPASPRQLDRLNQSSIRRHSFATRKESPRTRLRDARSSNQLDSPRIDRIYLEEEEETPRTPADTSSTRSNVGSASSRASTRASHGSSTYH